MEKYLNEYKNLENKHKEIYSSFDSQIQEHLEKVNKIKHKRYVSSKYCLFKMDEVKRNAILEYLESSSFKHLCSYLNLNHDQVFILSHIILNKCFNMVFKDGYYLELDLNNIKNSFIVDISRVRNCEHELYFDLSSLEMYRK